MATPIVAEEIHEIAGDDFAFFYCGPVVQCIGLAL